MNTGQQWPLERFGLFTRPSELIQDKKYAAMGKTPADRVKALLGQLDSVRSSQIRGSEVSGHTKALSHKFMGQVEQVFTKLPKSLEWRSFYNNDLPILMDICKEVRKISIQDGLNRSLESDGKDCSQMEPKDLSAREIKGIADGF